MPDLSPAGRLTSCDRIVQGRRCGWPVRITHPTDPTADCGRHDDDAHRFVGYFDTNTGTTECRYCSKGEH